MRHGKRTKRLQLIGIEGLLLPTVTKHIGTAGKASVQQCIVIKPIKNNDITQLSIQPAI